MPLFTADPVVMNPPDRCLFTGLGNDYQHYDPAPDFYTLQNRSPFTLRHKSQVETQPIVNFNILPKNRELARHFMQRIPYRNIPHAPRHGLMVPVFLALL